MRDFILSHARALREHPVLRDLPQLWCVENNWGQEATNVREYLSGMPRVFSLNEGKKRTREAPGVAPYIKEGLWTTDRVKVIGADKLKCLMANNAIHFKSDMVCANPFVNQNDDERRRVTLQTLFVQFGRFRYYEQEQTRPDRAPGVGLSGKINEQNKVVRGMYDDGILAMMLNVCYSDLLVANQIEVSEIVAQQCFFNNAHASARVVSEKVFESGAKRARY